MNLVAPTVVLALGMVLVPSPQSGESMPLRGKVVLVTGAARGIGAALAERLASHGARLALVGLEPETMAAVAERCGEDTFVAECDVSNSEQVTHAMKELRLRGIMMTTMIGNEEISAERFSPFWSKAEELGAVVFIHPEGFTGGGERFAGAGQLGNTIGMPLDTSVALSHMIFSGFLDKHPKAKIVLSHGGGFLPSYIGRADNCYVRSPQGCKTMAKAPSAYAIKRPLRVTRPVPVL